MGWQFHDEEGLIMLALAIVLSIYSLISSAKRVKNLPVASLKRVVNIVDSIVFIISVVLTIILGSLLIMTVVPW